MMGVTGVKAARQQLTAIQGLRGLAALLVVVDHALLTLIDKAGADPALAALAVLLGGVGVKLFFLISGLVMVLSSTHAFGAGASLTFMRRRLIRIVPLYWLTSALYIAKLALTGVALTWPEVLKSFLFIPFQNGAGEIAPLYGLGWTLNYEVFFYAIFALGLLGSLRSTLLGTAAVLACAVAWGASMPLGAANSMWEQAAYFWSRPITLFFVVGMFIALALLRLGPLSGLKRALPDLPLGLALAVSGLGVAAALALSWAGPWPIGAELAVLALPVIAASLGKAGAANGRIAALCVRLGDASYSIYLTHPFVVGPLARLCAQSGWTELTSPWGFSALCVAVSLALGLLVYRWVERPILRRLASSSSGRVPRGVAVRPSPP